MGVAGAGKTTIGRAVALSLGWAFHDADDFHTPASVAKMRAATPLTDDDRAPWLAALRAVVGRHLDSGTPAVLACSALRESYRAALLPAGAPEYVVSFVQLDISPALARERLSAREGHYMPASLVTSQFSTMEEPRGAMRLDGALAVSEIVAKICQWVGR